MNKKTKANTMSSKNPYSPPRAGDGFSVQLGARFPPICLKCARTDGVGWRPQQLTWVPPIAFPFAHAPFIRYIVSYLAKHTALHLPLCGECARRWRATSWVAFLQYGLIVSFVLAIGVGRVIADPLLTFLVGATTMFLAILVPTSLELFYLRRVSIWARAITGVTVTLGGVHPEAARAVDEAWAEAWRAAEAEEKRRTQAVA